jgi:DNA-binding transcriptional LysR family regulator
MLDYASLAAVAAVAREGSFDKAAAQLGVTPSAVSQRVKSLEERVGAILLTRGVPCRPTDIGAKLCAHVEQVRLLEGEVIRDLPGLAGPTLMSSTVRVAVNADSVSTWFPEAAAQFAAETGAMLDLVLEDEAHTADRLRSGEVLAAVTADPSPVSGCKPIRSAPSSMWRSQAPRSSRASSPPGSVRKVFKRRRFFVLTDVISYRRDGRAKRGVWRSLRRRTGRPRRRACWT